MHLNLFIRMDHKMRRKILKTPGMMCHLFVSWLAGTFITSTFIFPLLTFDRIKFPYGDKSFITNLYLYLIDGIFIYMIALIITIPLMAITIIVALLFQKSIEKNMPIWCFFAPFPIWIFCGFFSAIVCDNSYCQNHSFSHIFYIKTIAQDNTLFLLGVAPSAIIFYILRKRAQARAATKKIYLPVK